MVGLIAKPYNAAVNSFTGSAWTSKYPPSNVINNDYGRVARTTSASAGSNSYHITLDLGSEQTVDTVSVLWHNLRATDTIMIYAGLGEDLSTAGNRTLTATRPAVTGGTKRDHDFPKKMVYKLASPIQARYVKIYLQAVGSAHPDGYLQASRFFVGKAAQFAIGAQKATLGAKDMNANVTTEIGENRSQEDPLLIRPVAALSFSYAKQSEMEEVLGAYTLALGVSRPMMVCTDLESAYLQDNTVFGRPEQVLTQESTIYDVWSFEAVVTSIGP